VKILTIDTSTTACSVAVSVNDEIVSSCLGSRGRALSASILDTVAFVLKGAGIELEELDGFGVAVGPGSFTGLRVGLATVKGLALATGKPIAGFSSLAMLAMNLPWASHPVCPMFDARKKEVYTGLYTCRDTPDSLMADRVVTPEPFLESLDGTVIFIGEGAVRYRERIVAILGERALFAPQGVNLPHASAGALLAATVFSRGAAVPPELLAPVYIRPSEAELARLSGKIH
jgi:tRNA threonylcarbamoyladenosine biosynthesis protein TsaB